MLTPGALSPPWPFVPPSQVCAKPPSNKMQPQDWILATVLRYSPATSKYTILDEDDADADPWAESSAREHQVSRRMVLRSAAAALGLGEHGGGRGVVAEEGVPL